VTKLFDAQIIKPNQYTGWQGYITMWLNQYIDILVVPGRTRI